MAYRWKPSKSARRAFAEKMNNDPEYRDAYYKRKEERAERRRASSQFDYETAGGEYVPTKLQHDAAFQLLASEHTQEEKEAANIVISGYSCQEKVPHDYIHIVNEFIRREGK